MSLDQLDELMASGPVLLAFLVSVLAGLVSFASPCVVPLVPGYLSYLAAVVGVEDQPGLATPSAEKGVAVRTARLRVAGAASLFVAGFTAVFVLGTVAVLGMTTTLITNQLLLQRIGGVITIVMGLVFVGFIPVLQRDARFAPRQLSTLGGAPLLGAVFALGWTPCLGPRIDRRDRSGLSDRGCQRMARRGAGYRLLLRPGNSFRTVGIRFSAGRTRAGLAARACAGHPDFRRGAAHPRRHRVGDRRVERVRVLGA